MCINQKQGFEPLKLAEVLRLKRSIFKSHSEHALLISTLRNLKAKVESNVEKQKSDNGNRKFLYQQEVESNMPEAIDLVIPLIKSEKPTEITVNIVVETDGYDLICYLVSVDGAEKIDDLFNNIIDEELSKIDDDILVIEQ